MNVSVLNPNECCGCTACYATCPTRAITMQADEIEGFLYPLVNEDKCINCGKCLRVCKDVHPYDEKQKVYACWSKDDSLRAKSSSGGVFSLLAEKILVEGGAVCAVGYSDDCKECLHKIIRTTDGLDDLRRAKFVQSKKYDVFIDTKAVLESGVKVLFCGTPCEVGGLRQFLGKEYENLFTCDLICGCVSSPMVYRTYIDYLNKKFGAHTVSVNFKDKRKGWRGKAIAVEFDNGKEYYNSIFDDDYCVSFHSRFNIRPSCFNCKYRSLQRVADITLGDFWAIEKYMAEYDDNRGTSFVLVNTIKGDILLKGLDMYLHPMEIDFEEYAKKYNWCMCCNPSGMPEDERRNFYNDVKSMPFDKMAEKDLEVIKQTRKQKKIEQKQL
ncbi:MAG: Coenzyme F420 hydrogenase/dehydrogenase, beta subunit C-terminal domain [Bacteroidales bacterium]|nr:Coenzyme F420 hydrogenase/dehydrogenase, beta subunit C-terminal domain [Bacteroidales bacterium]